MRQRPEYGSWKTNSANCAANDHLKQPARQSRPSFSPHTRAMGGTFESTFVFAKPANLDNTRPQKRESTNPRSETRAASAKRRPTAKPTRPRLTEEEKRELRRIRASENRQRRKELGLCKDCPNQAIKGQTRCPNCVETHRRTRQPQRK